MPQARSQSCPHTARIWLRADDEEKVHDKVEDFRGRCASVGGGRNARARGGDLGARQLRVLLPEWRSGPGLLDASRRDGSDARWRDPENARDVGEGAPRSSRAGKQAVLNFPGRTERVAAN